MKFRKNVYFSVIISALMIGGISYADSNEYETYTKGISKSYIQSTDIPQEVKLDISELSNFEYFKNKTNSNYEVALAHENGKYTFYKDANTYDEAVDIAKNIQPKNKNIIPTVINKDGVIEYTTNSIGRVVKIGQGISEDSINFTTNLYENSNKTGEYTYINHGFIDDVPVIEETENMVKVEIAGFTGWMEKKDDKGLNISLIPINQAKNLSYYKVYNNQLNHYISSNVQGDTGTTRNIGKAPDFMKNGVKYYSYDGNYFYDDINKLINDLKSNNHNNSVNNNIYYNYYQYLPSRSKSSFDAADIDKYFDNNTKYGSVLRGTGKFFIKAQNKYGVNATFMVGIAMNESGRGQSDLAKNKNNIFGIDARDDSPSDAKKFDSIEDCINKFARDTMSNGYLNPKSWKYNGSNLGNKNNGCNVMYASDPYWSEKASSYMNEMDEYLLNTIGIRNDYNRYKIGILNNTSNINDKNGNKLYTLDKGEVALISDDRNSNIEINPDRITPYDVTNPIPGSYDWTCKGYIKNSNIDIVNNQKEKVILDTIIGENRYQTAAMIADNQNYTSAILVNGDNSLADGLSASGLSGITKSPILLTQKESIPNETKERLKGVNKIYLVGGKNVISSKIENELKSQKKQVIRLSGNNREETSYAVAREMKNINPKIEKLFLVNGYKGEADAMSISSVASRDCAPIILTNGEDINFNTNNIKSYVIGGKTIMNEKIVKKSRGQRIGGVDRFDTNKLVINKFYPTANEFYISKGYILVDALTVSPLAKNYPVVFVYNKSDKSLIKNATKIIQVGGMDQEIIDECINIID